MADFGAQIEKSKSEVKAAQSKIAELTSAIETARAKIDSGADISIDIENATLDDVTAGFSKDFDAMRDKTGWETFVGVFAAAKSESMRQERMRTASIDDKLQDLIGKSDVIVALLESHANKSAASVGIRE